MTKPSYEEPDYFALCAEHGALREKNSLPYATCVRCLLASSEQKRYAAEAENLRVRGLLQRFGGHTATCNIRLGLHNDGFCDCGWAQVGAESADIGKLDRADKAGMEMGKVSRVDEKATLKVDVAYHCDFTLCETEEE